MKKVIFLLMIVCIVFTGCKKDKETESELNIESNSIYMEKHSEAEQISKTTTAYTVETTDSGTSTNQLQTAVTETETAATEKSLDAGNTLQKAVTDKEEKAAIKAVQEEERIYYKNPTLDFDPEAYANLNISSYGFGGLTSANGSNIHQYFFESKSMSGTDSLYLQKACEGYSGITFDADKVKSSTGKSLEDSECLAYQNDSAYVELHQDGTCMMYNKNHISEILGQKIPSGMWNPSNDSKSHFYIWTFQTWKSRNPDDGFPNQDELSYLLNGEIVSVAEACAFLFEYFMQSIEAGWISSLYQVEAFTPVSVELMEYKNGSYGYYFTIQLHTSKTLLPVDYTDKTAYLNPERAVKGQYIQVLMLSKDSVDYISLPSTLTRTPDYTQTVQGTYCTLSEACEILSEYLSSGHVYDVKNINIQYETVYLNEGIVQSPMWHFEVTSLTGEEAKYDILYADIDLETKELYISYR